MTLLELELALHTVSESNARGHWGKRAKRAKEQRGVVCLALRARQPSNWVFPAVAPLVVTIARVAPRALDDDNLRGALKGVRDGVADWLEINDRDPRVSWAYAQERGGVRQYAVKIRVERMGS